MTLGIINDIKKIITEFKKSWKDFVLGFSLGFIVAICISFWFFFTAYSALVIAAKDLPILEYLTITLTLFGFTLVGGIFEKKDPGKLPPIAKSLFKDSLIFLSSGASFLLAYSTSFLLSELFTNISFSKNIFQFAYIVGALTLAIAIWRLLIDLFLFYWNINEKT